MTCGEELRSEEPPSSHTSLPNVWQRGTICGLLHTCTSVYYSLSHRQGAQSSVNSNVQQFVKSYIYGHNCSVLYIVSPNIQLQAINKTMFLCDKFQNSTLYFLTFKNVNSKTKMNYKCESKTDSHCRVMS